MLANLSDGSAPTIANVAELRARMWAAGLRPIALYSADVTHTDGGELIPPESRGKRPRGARWQDRARRDPPDDAVAQPRGNALNTGILCDGLPVLDLDIDNAAVVDQLRKLAADTLGETIVRTRGNSPRCAMVYRAADGEPGKRVIIGDAGKIEVLGRGQQLHAFGRHPSGVEVEWYPEPPGVRTRDDIPAVTEEQITAYLGAAAQLIGAPSPGATPRIRTTVEPPLNLGPRPQHIEHTQSRNLNAAAHRSPYTLAEVTAAVGSFPSGYPGHPLGGGDAWRSEFMFPLADYAARHPEHRASVRVLFCQHTRRIADPALVAAYPGGADAYFAAAEKRFDAEVRNRSTPVRHRR
jgi:hypothetical protein